MHVLAACVTVKVWPAIVRVPVREVVPVLSPTLNVTVPFPVPLPLPVTVIHGAFDTADHAQPAETVTATLPVPPVCDTDWLVGLIEAVHGAWKEKLLETALAAEPPGPSALTRVSYKTPGVGAVASSETKLTRILPSASGVGLARSTVSTGVVAPATYNASV